MASCTVSNSDRESKKNCKEKIVFTNPLEESGFVPERGSEVCIREIPEWIDEMDLMKFFAKAGEIFQFRLVMNDDLSEHKGYGYITYCNAEAAGMAMELGELEPLGRKLSVERNLVNNGFFISGLPINKTKEQILQELETNGFENIVDVIMCRGSSISSLIFVEFETHQLAADAKAKYANNLKLWDTDVVVDWCLPEPKKNKSQLEKETALYLINLDATQTIIEIESIISRYVSAPFPPRVYKFADYALVHLSTRQEAEKLMERLKEHYKNTAVRIEWTRPRKKYTSITGYFGAIRSTKSASESGEHSNNENFTPVQSSDFPKERSAYVYIPGIADPTSDIGVVENQPIKHLAKMGQFPVAEPCQDYMTRYEAWSSDSQEYTNYPLTHLLDQLCNDQPCQGSIGSFYCNGFQYEQQEVIDQAILYYQKRMTELVQNRNFVLEEVANSIGEAS